MDEDKSFAYQIKEKLCVLPPSKTVSAFGAGLFFLHAGNVRNDVLRTEFPEAVTLLEPHYLAKTGSQLPFAPIYHEKDSVRKPVTVKFLSPIEKSREQLLSVFGLWELTGTKLSVHENIMNNEARAAAFLRGMFIARGVVNPPEKDCHLEFFGLTASQATALSELLVSLSFACATTSRSGKYGVYFKDGEQIEYLLALIGANDAMFEISNARIKRDMQNRINRQINCDTANLAKSQEAAAIQIENIRLILQKEGLDSLPEPLREIAQARLDNEEASLSELATICGIGRSAVNHRLKKLSTLADEIKGTPEKTTIL